MLKFLLLSTAYEKKLGVNFSSFLSVGVNDHEVGTARICLSLGFIV